MKEAIWCAAENSLQRIEEEQRLKDVVNQSPYAYLLHPVRLAVIIIIPLIVVALNHVSGKHVPSISLCCLPFLFLAVIESSRKRAIKKARMQLQQVDKTKKD